MCCGESIRDCYSLRLGQRSKRRICQGQAKPGPWGKQRDASDLQATLQFSWGTDKQFSRETEIVKAANKEAKERRLLNFPRAKREVSATLGDWFKSWAERVGARNKRKEEHFIQHFWRQQKEIKESWRVKSRQISLVKWSKQLAKAIE